MSKPARPERLSSAPIKRRIIPLMGMAWLMLIYTWVLGHCPETLHGLPSGLAPSWDVTPWLASSSFGFGNLFRAPAAHSLCLFKQLVGLPCVFCGVTRSFILLGQGQWEASLQYHLLGIPLYLTTILIALFGWFYPQQVETILVLLRHKGLVTLLIGLLVACWIWKLGQNPVFW